MNTHRLSLFLHAGFPILLADASSPPTIEGIYKDPQTSTPFPSTLKSDNSNLILIGTGVRVVSFLSVKVYCAAFYVDEKVLNKLSTIEGWKVSVIYFASSESDESKQRTKFKYSNLLGIHCR